MFGCEKKCGLLHEEAHLNIIFFKELYSLVWVQCSQIMKANIEVTDNFTKICTNLDVLELIKYIKYVYFHFEK